MRLLVDDTDTHRLFMEKDWIGIKRWIIENKETHSIKTFNSLWYKQQRVVEILRKL
tara:strand:+ start:78 stop:245 length:168 start_codon:yes stop_codon:yes gene_type:complete